MKLVEITSTGTANLIGLTSTGTEKQIDVTVNTDYEGVTAIEGFDYSFDFNFE